MIRQPSLLKLEQKPCSVSKSAACQRASHGELAELDVSWRAGELGDAEIERQNQHVRVDVESREADHAPLQSGVEQREGSMTSADWLRSIKAVIQNIDKAIAQYSSWRPTANRLETAKPLLTMLLYIVEVIRNKLTSDGPQPVVQSEPKISLDALRGWLHLRVRRKASTSRR